MLGMASPTSNFSVVCPLMLITEHDQNLEDQAEGSLVSDHDLLDLNL